MFILFNILIHLLASLPTFGQSLSIADHISLLESQVKAKQVKGACVPGTPLSRFLPTCFDFTKNECISIVESAHDICAAKEKQSYSGNMSIDMGEFKTSITRLSDCTLNNMLVGFQHRVKNLPQCKKAAKKVHELVRKQ